MTAHRLVNRRILLKDMGKTGVAVMLFGTAACSEEPTSNATPTEEPSTQPSSSATSQLGGGAGSGSSGEGHEWHRVNLGFVSAYILYRNGEATIVDTGVDGSTPAIEAALAEVGLAWGDVSGLILTHRHPDHQGSVQGVLASTPADTPWYAGEGDLGAINAPYAGQSVGDGDNVNDLEIIETPGHTPGHISIRDGAAGVLVAGDALRGTDDGVLGSDPDFTDDMDLANVSVAKLAGFDYEVILFGHGEPVLEDGSSAVADLAATLG
ncbi:MAG TPA: MBL fold metallo-hydrolase [Acidimicrobiia bacterium]|jgi:glyoxylase-like metal-dependent hydrolase (beta-lactamase superfamily II)|nr:MBL fold metallo-hydrolase [Acidimicrobiia bacterium]